jgi:hypothetical protein
MTGFEEKLHQAFFEGWEELGIEDPQLSTNINYTDEEISAKAPAPYGLGSYDREETHDAMSKHPSYVEQVRLLLSDIKDQIHHWQKFGKRRPLGNIADLPNSLALTSKITMDIAKEIGWGDPRDIHIAIQRHPFVIQLLRIRDALKDRSKKKGI